MWFSFSQLYSPVVPHFKKITQFYLLIFGCTRSSSWHVGFFSCSTGTRSCGTWNLVPWRRIEPMPSTLGAWSLSRGPPGESQTSLLFQDITWAPGLAALRALPTVRAPPQAPCRWAVCCHGIWFRKASPPPGLYLRGWGPRACRPSTKKQPLCLKRAAVAPAEGASSPQPKLVFWSQK